MSERTKAILGILAILTALNAPFAVVAVLEPAYRATQRLPFNATDWRAHRWKDERAHWLRGRQRMVADVIVQRTLDGLTRREVEALLGPEDETVHWRDWDLRYELGGGPVVGHLWDREWLVVRFGADRRVEAYRVLND